MKKIILLLGLFLSLTSTSTAGILDSVWPTSAEEFNLQFSDVYNKPFWQNSWFVPVVVTAVVAGGAVVTVMTGGAGAPAAGSATVSVFGFTLATVKTSTIAAAVYGGGAGSYMGGLAVIGSWFGGNAMLGAMILNGAVAAGGVVANGAVAYTTTSLAEHFGLAPDLAAMSKPITISTENGWNLVEKAVTGVQFLAQSSQNKPKVMERISQQILTVGPQPKQRAAQTKAKLVQLRLELADAQGQLLKTVNSKAKQIYDVPLIMGNVYGNERILAFFERFRIMNMGFDQGNINQQELTTLATILLKQVKATLEQLATRDWNNLTVTEQRDFVGCLLLIGQFQDNDTLVKYAEHITADTATNQGFLWYIKALAAYKKGQALAIIGDKSGALHAFKQAMTALDVAIQSEPAVLENLMLKAIVLDTLGTEDPALYRHIESLAAKVAQHSKDHYTTPNTTAAVHELFGDIYRNAGLFVDAQRQYTIAWGQVGAFDDNMEKAVLSIKMAKTYQYLGDKTQHAKFLATGRNFVVTWADYLGMADPAEQAQNAQQIEALYQAL